MGIKLMQQQLVQKASQILRDTSVYQVRNTLSDSKGGFCAKGAILNYFGWDGDFKNWNKEAYQQFNEHCKLGDELVRMNDRYNMSFEEIADYLEERGL